MVYNVGIEHRIKNEVLARHMAGYAGYGAKHAIAFPSITCDDIEFFARNGIHDVNTRYLIYEKDFRVDEFEALLSRRMNEIFGVERFMSRYAVLVHNDVRKDFPGLDMKDEFDFAYYDTCSFFHDFNRWFPNHVDALKPGSPVCFTFDADYEQRKKDGYGWLSQYEGKKHQMGMRHLGLDRIDFENAISMARRACCLANYLVSLGISVNGVELYRSNNRNFKTMLFISGEKQKRRAKCKQ